MTFQVLPSKLVGERITVRFEFMDEFEWGETISVAIVTAEVLSGVATDELDLIRSAPSIGNTEVVQSIHLGTPGVIYALACQVTGSTGGIYRKVVKLAVLPSPPVTPPLYGTLLTSLLYPIEATESIDSSTDLISGTLVVIVIEAAFSDDLSSGTLLLSAELRDPIVTYSFDEFLDSTSVLFSSELREPIVTIEISESVDSTTVIQGVTLEQIVIQYQNYLESIDTTTSLIGGTLV